MPTSADGRIGQSWTEMVAWPFRGDHWWGARHMLGCRKRKRFGWRPWLKLRRCGMYLTAEINARLHIQVVHMQRGPQ